jgi:hypothetical protein
MTKPIEKIWDDLLSRGRAAWPVFQRVDDSHPIDLYAGIETDGARLLMLVSGAEPSQLPNYHAFDVVKARRDDGRWTLSVRLRLVEFATIFAHLCDDLIAASRTECRPEEAAVYVVARIQRWQKLLGRDFSGLLDQHAIRGLIGELLFLQKVACVGRELISAVRSWEGPLDAPQDFRFESRFAEVKTCGPASPVVWISSAEQLDVGSMPIVLAAAFIVAADPAATGSFTLPSLVEELRAFLAASPPAAASFEERLKLAGYSDRPEYTKDCFGFREFRFFDVSEAFPKFERRLLPEAITTVKYQLDLLKCRPFEREGAGI